MRDRLGLNRYGLGDAEGGESRQSLRAQARVSE
jgi:hypothetical protein